MGFRLSSAGNALFSQFRSDMGSVVRQKRLGRKVAGFLVFPSRMLPRPRLPLVTY